MLAGLRRLLSHFFMICLSPAYKNTGFAMLFKSAANPCGCDKLGVVETRGYCDDVVTSVFCLLNSYPIWTNVLNRVNLDVLKTSDHISGSISIPASNEAKYEHL